MSMPNVDVNAIRNRCWHSLNPATADAAGCTLQQLQQFLLGGYTPTEAQLQRLSRYFRCCGHA